MSVEQNSNAGPFNVLAGGFILPADPGTIISDPAGAAGSEDVTITPFTTVYNVTTYVVPLDMTLKAIVDFSLINTNYYGSQVLGVFLRNITTGTDISAGYTFEVAAGITATKSNIHIGDCDVVAGDEIAVVLKYISGDAYDVIVFDCRVAYIPVNIPYQENITIDIADSAPKISAWDVLQGINYNRLLAFDTNDRTKVVTISYDEDKYQPISAGISLVGREDFTDTPVKGNPLKAKRIIFEWDDDKDDFYLTSANTAVGERGWGGIIRDIEGGTLKEKRIKMPFAATAMRVYPGGLFIPVMRENGVRAAVPGEEDRNFERTPRLLLADGVAFNDSAGWTLGAAPFDLYPKCFFVRPGETDLSMAFGPETLHGTSGPGTVALHYGPYLRRLEKSLTYSIDLMLYDHEMKGLDFGVPVEVRDKFGTGWYYFTEIKRKQFGRDIPTRCDLIQV